MNQTIKELFERKSVRVFSEKPVTEENKSLILNACLQAPTAGNQILYSIIDVTDQAIKDELAITCDNQPFIAKAPVVLVFLADCRRWLDAYNIADAHPREPGLGDIMLSCNDALVAAQNAVVAAESLGIGSCYIGDIVENAEKHIELLKLDKYVMPIAMLVMGYPTESQKARKKPKRFDKKYIVFENSYRRLTEEEQHEMFEEQSNSEKFDFDDYITKFCNRKYNSDFSDEMNRSTALYLKNYK